MPIQLPPDRPPSPPAHPHLSPPSPGAESASQKLSRLQAELKVSHMARIAAERKVLELEDAARGKEGVMKGTEDMLANAEGLVDELKIKLAEQDIIIERLRADATTFPLSSPALLRSHHLLAATFSSLRESFSCPICFEPLLKSSAVSLSCGHTFCESCLFSWTSSKTEYQVSAQAWKSINRWDCPECRMGSAGPGEKKVRLYMLEEAIRLVGRAERERLEVEEEEKKRRAGLEQVDPTLLAPTAPKAKDAENASKEPSGEPVAPPAASVTEPMQVEEEVEDVPMLFAERKRTPYGGVFVSREDTSTS